MPSSVPPPAPGQAQRAARNVAVVAGGELTGKLATLVFAVLAARGLGPAGYGAFAYALSYGLLLATIPSWGFDSVLLRRGGTDVRDLPAALAQTLALRGALAVPVLLLGGAAGALTRPSRAAALALLLVLLACVADTFGDAGRAAAAAVERRGRAALALVVQRVAAAAIAAALLAQGAGLVPVAGGYLAASLLGQLLILRAVRRLGIRPDWAQVGRPQLAAMWRSSLVLGLDTLAAMALFRLDALLLGAIRGDAELAAYAVAYRLLETVLFVTWTVSRTLFPAMSRAARGPDAVRLGEQALTAVGTVFVPYTVVLLIAGPDLLRLLFGAQFTGAGALAVRLLALAPLAFAVSYLASDVLIARARSREVLVATAVGAGANLALNLAVIPRYGAAGAAVATTASYAVEGAVAVVLAARLGRWLRVDRALALPLLAAPAAVLALAAAPGPVLLRCLLAAVGYAATWLLLGRWRFPEQVALLRSVVRR